MDQLRSEFYETISNLNRKFNKKIKEHMNRIERQQDQLNHQNGIIEELAWQIRDLRDSLRKCNEQISWPQSKYCVGCAKNRMKLNIPTANGTAHTIDHVPGKNPLYETIKFDAIVHSDADQRNKLKRQDAIDGNVRNSGVCRDVKSFLERCIPPPPMEPPPSDEESEIAFSPLEFSSETLEKLNSLYSLYKDSPPIYNENDNTPDVEYRLPEFNDTSARLLRDSNRAMCSMVSNNEGDYVSLSEHDEHSIKSLNESDNRNRMHDMDEHQKETEKNSTESDEVYI